MPDRSDPTTGTVVRPSAETRGLREYDLQGSSTMEEENIHSEGMDPLLQLITQTDTPRGPMQTDSNEDL